MKLLAPALVLTAAVLGGCAQTPTASPGLIEVTERPAEKALLAGIRAYEDGQYAEAESLLGKSLQTGLSSLKDQAAAHKHLAFILCTSNRYAQCETAFRAARRADPNFALTKAEAGHPLWGPVYGRLKP